MHKPTYGDTLVEEHDRLIARRAELDAERRQIGIEIEDVTMTLRTHYGYSLVETGELLGVKYETVRRRCARMEARLEGDDLPPTWRGYKTPRQIRQLADDTEPVDEIVLGDPDVEAQPSLFEEVS